MKLEEAISLLSANAARDPKAFNDAISAIREDTLNRFIASQFTGGNIDNVEVNVSSAVQKQLFDRIRQQWTAVGEREPYVSVLADEKYSLATIAENMVEFRESGMIGIRQLQQLAIKNGVPVPYGTCMELGCGVGRLTAHLARNFQRVIAFDISPANLSVCNDYMHELALTNVDRRLLTDITELETIEEFDVFISFIVIQHNPPPIQKYLLEVLLSKLRPGGLFLFQTIVNSPGYVYSAAGNFLYREGLDYEMHCLPMQHVLQTINDRKLRLLDVVKEYQGGWNVDSFTFFGINPQI